MIQILTIKISSSLIRNIIFFITCFFMLNNKVNSTIVGKACFAPHECWGTEPMNALGVPLSIESRISKRLIIGGNSRGVKCRCKSGMCQFFSFSKNTNYFCDEF
uniref:Apple domain-containing protein n=1 Tax=Rhabditophanes sp. KR3021 TaxID=114890 RepID=A0AC35U5L5_9BILA